MKRSIFVCVLGTALLFAGNAFIGFSAAQEAAAVVGMTNDFRFNPERVTIRAGETVEWTNSSTAVHTVTADPGKAANPDNVDLPAEAEPFDSGSIQTGDTYRRTFKVPGLYKYICIPHETMGMIGEIEVQPAGG